MPPSPKKCLSPGGTHWASPLTCCIRPGGQNLARTCPQVFLAGSCSWLLLLTVLSHLGLGVGCFLSPLTFWRFFTVFGQLACLSSNFLAPRVGWALNCGAFAAAPAQGGHPKPNMPRCGMGAKTPFSFKKSVEILNLHLLPLPLDTDVVHVCQTVLTPYQKAIFTFLRVHITSPPPR